MNPTHKTLQLAIDSAKHNNRRICHEKGQVDNMNMSTIYTMLIQAAGRWCESYASDLLYDIKNINEYIKTPTTKSETATFPTAFRESGVDGTDFLMARLEDTIDPMHNYCVPEKIYRKIYILEITKNKNDVTADLYDITHDLYRFDTSDRTK